LLGLTCDSEAVKADVPQQMVIEFRQTQTRAPHQHGAQQAA
jgi:hypothetical protein